MSTLFAVAWDSFREATDRSISTIMVMISIAMGLLALAVGFPESPVEDLCAIASNEASYPVSAVWTRVDARTAELALVRPAETPLAEAPPPEILPSEDGREGGRDGRRNRGARRRIYDSFNEMGEVPPGGRGSRAAVAHAAEKVQAILERRGVKSVTVTDAGTDAEPRARFALAYDPMYVRGATKLSYVFGTLEIDRKIREDANIYVGVSGSEALLTIEGMLVNGIAGFFGLILAVIITAGFVPTMLSGGTAHLLLAKPIWRPTLLIGKYLGGVGFVAFHSLVLTSLVVLAVYLRTGLFEARLLLAPASLSAVFAILYAASCLAGVLFETSVVSILAAMFLWMLSWAAVTSHNVVHNADRLMPEAKFEIPPKLKQGLNVFYLVMPKTGDISQIFEAYVSKGRVSEETERMSEELRKRIDPATVLWTSALFTLALLGAACLVFQMKDY